MQILGKNLLVITAHPDDESFLVAGTIYANSLKGGETTLVCATAGEKGKHHYPGKITAQELGKIRKKELHEACDCVKVSRLFILNFPDGRLAEKKNEFSKFCEKIAKKYIPDFILGFGPDGITGHIDHIAAHEVALKLSKKTKIPFLQFTLPEKLLKHGLEWFKTRRRSPHYKDKVIYSHPDITLSINPKIKLKALKMHRSQMLKGDPLFHFPKYAANEMLKHECFCHKR